MNWKLGRKKLVKELEKVPKQLASESREELPLTQMLKSLLQQKLQLQTKNYNEFHEKFVMQSMEVKGKLTNMNKKNDKAFDQYFFELGRILEEHYLKNQIDTQQFIQGICNSCNFNQENSSDRKSRRASIEQRKPLTRRQSSEKRTLKTERLPDLETLLDMFKSSILNEDSKNSDQMEVHFHQFKELLIRITDQGNLHKTLKKPSLSYSAKSKEETINSLINKCEERKVYIQKLYKAFNILEGKVLAGKD